MIKVTILKEKEEETVLTAPRAYVTETFIPISDLYKKGVASQRDEEEGFFDVAITEKKEEADPVAFRASRWAWRAANSTLLGYALLAFICCGTCLFLAIFFGSLYFKDMIVANIDVDVLLRQVTVEIPSRVSSVFISSH